MIMNVYMGVFNCLLFGDDKELSNPPNVSALLGNVGETYVTL